MTPNPRYRRGVSLEYRVKRYLEAEGYSVTRAAGSHGAADLVAMNGHQCLAIQVKGGGFDRKKAYSMLLSIPAAKWLRRQVWTWNRGEEHPSVLWSDGEEPYV